MLQHHQDAALSWAATSPGCGGRPNKHAAVRDERPQIFSVATDGSKPRALNVFGVALARGPTGRIAFLHGGRLAVMNDDGRGFRMLGRANTGSENPVAPAWSPDGRQIAVEDGSGCDPYGPCQRWRVSIVDVASGAQPERIAYARQPSWSPDGSELAYVGGFTNGDRRAKDPFAVFVARPDGKGGRRIARGDYPAWSPRRRLIAYYALGRRGGFFGLHLVRPDGSYERKVSQTEAVFAWSPDGTRLAFNGPFGSPASLTMTSLQDGRKRRIGPASFTKPGGIAWSPDGSKLAWVAYDAGPNEDRLLIAPVSGSEKPRELAQTHPRQRIWTPVFSSDGKRVLYSVW